VNRSSHDVAVVGDTLVVVGGWNMRGIEGSKWVDDMLLLDLNRKPLEWKSVAQPFKRRAFVTAVRGGSLFVIGGFDGADKVITDVDVYDIATNTWSKAAPLPKGSRNGFSPAAAFLDGRLYVSLMDGGVYRLNEAANEWERVANTLGRVAHRMVAAPEHRLLLLGGATNGDNLDTLERIDVGVPSRTAAK
jgi:N-acetylneuraminic acid mutarotase